jgi:DNA-binding transcriptional LysR family regulator
MKPYVLSELELRHLVALQAIAAAGSYWAAAEQLGCSQSALSQQITKLESIVGVRLIDRSRGRRVLALTEAGRLLLRHAQAIVVRLRAAHADFSTFAEGAADTLRVGVFESVGARVLPLALREFRRKLPKVEVRLTELAKDDQLLALVESGEIDLSFAILPLPEGPFDSVVLLEDPYVLVVAADAPQMTRDPARLADLQSVPLITTGPGRSFEQVEAYIRSRGIALNIVFRSNHNGTVQGLAAAGEGAALAALLTVDERREDTRLSGPIPGFPPRVIAMAWHHDRYRSPAAEAFIATAREVCGELAARNGLAAHVGEAPRQRPARRTGVVKKSRLAKD